MIHTFIESGIAIFMKVSHGLCNASRRSRRMMLNNWKWVYCANVQAKLVLCTFEYNNPAWEISIKAQMEWLGWDCPISGLGVARRPACQWGIRLLVTAFIGFGTALFAFIACARSLDTTLAQPV